MACVNYNNMILLLLLRYCKKFVGLVGSAFTSVFLFVRCPFERENKIECFFLN